MRVTECCLNACESDMSKKANATESLWYKGVATFSSGGETRDWCFQISLISQGIGVMAISAAADRVFSMDDHVVNSRRENLKRSSVNDILFFKQCSENEAPKLN